MTLPDLLGGPFSLAPAMFRAWLLDRSAVELLLELAEIDVVKHEIDEVIVGEDLGLRCLKAWFCFWSGACSAP